MSDDERVMLRRIERRTNWIGQTLIGCIVIVLWYSISHNERISEVWGLTEDARDYLGIGIALVVGFVLEAVFKRG
jgi:hypothetical protein